MVLPWNDCLTFSCLAYPPGKVPQQEYAAKSLLLVQSIHRAVSLRRGPRIQAHVLRGRSQGVVCGCEANYNDQVRPFQRRLSRNSWGTSGSHKVVRRRTASDEENPPWSPLGSRAAVCCRGRQRARKADAHRPQVVGGTRARAPGFAGGFWDSAAPVARRLAKPFARVSPGRAGGFGGRASGQFATPTTGCRCHRRFRNCSERGTVPAVFDYWPAGSVAPCATRWLSK